MNSAAPPTLLECSVRDCGQPLARSERVWKCLAGHSFDVARSGYVNLLQPQDRRSLEAGDSPEAVAARRSLLDTGFGAALEAALLEVLGELHLPSGARALDLGCGEGHFLAAAGSHHSLAGLGIDLSAAAIEAAAKRHRGITWVVANADRRLPVASGSVEAALSIDGRRPRDEVARVLAPAGRFVVAVPGARDLAELRDAVFGRSTGESGVERLGAELSPAFRLVTHRSAAARIPLDRTALAALAAATYRCARHREREALDGLERLEVTTDHDVCVFERRR
jgi:23S rRNA (guanine745-N1)-methyltransferase